jgi:hypothetical protein
MRAVSQPFQVIAAGTQWRTGLVGSGMGKASPTLGMVLALLPFTALSPREITIAGAVRIENNLNRRSYSMLGAASLKIADGTCLRIHPLGCHRIIIYSVAVHAGNGSSDAPSVKVEIIPSLSFGTGSYNDHDDQDDHPKNTNDDHSIYERVIHAPSPHSLIACCQASYLERKSFFHCSVS